MASSACRVAALFGAYVVAKNSFAGVDGWRWLLIAGGLGAVFVVAVQKSLPESPRWLAARGRNADTAAVVDDIERKVRRSLGRSKLDYEPAPQPVAEAVEQQRVPLADMFRTYRSRTIMLTIVLGVAVLSETITVPVLLGIALILLGQALTRYRPAAR